MTFGAKLKRIFIISTLLFCNISFAAEDVAVAQKSQDPVRMLQGLTERVLAALKKNHAQLEANPKKIYPLVDSIILPYVDFNEMSLWVAGRTAWGKATEHTKDAFILAFKELVVKTYAQALNNYTNETVYFAPQKIDTNKDRIQINSTIRRNNKSDIRLDYRLIRHEDKWLVYDIIIEGVSILQGFQAQFTDEIRQKGLDKVIVQIREHNSKSDA